MNELHIRCQPDPSHRCDRCSKRSSEFALDSPGLLAEAVCHDCYLPRMEELRDLMHLEALRDHQEYRERRRQFAAEHGARCSLCGVRADEHNFRCQDGLALCEHSISESAECDFHEWTGHWH